MNILNEIIAVKKSEIEKLRRDYSLSRFSDSPFFDRKGKSLNSALSYGDEIAVIAEIKKASPSKGIIKEDFNHLHIAEDYINNETNAISILTDKNFFQGNISYMYDVAQISPIPLLRKDFIIDEYQIYEAKSNGADAILLIAENLSPNQIIELTEAAKENDLEVLLELHSEDEIKKIDFIKNQIIGINNRNLKTFNVDLNTTVSLGKLLPDNITVISESGISTQEDIDKLKTVPVDGILVGEHLMTKSDTGKALEELKTWCRYEN